MTPNRDDMSRRTLLLVVPAVALALPLASWSQGTGSKPGTVSFAVRFMREETAGMQGSAGSAHDEGSSFPVRDDSGRRWLASATNIIDASHVARAELVATSPDEPGFPNKGLKLWLTPAGQQRLGDETEAHIGQPIGIFVDERLAVVAIVRTRLGGRALQVNGSTFSPGELERAAQAFNSARS